MTYNEAIAFLAKVHAKKEAVAAIEAEHERLVAENGELRRVIMETFSHDPVLACEEWYGFHRTFS